MTANKPINVRFRYYGNFSWSWLLSLGAREGMVKKGEWRHFVFWMDPKDGDKTGFEGAVERFKRLAVDWPPAGHRVLVINDDSGMITLMTLILNNAGLQAQGTTTAEQGLELLRREEFDLLVLDDMMPGLDGLQVLQIMRADPRWDDLPILVCGGRGDKEFDRQCFELGADDHLQIAYITELSTERVMTLLTHGRKKPDAA